MLLAILSQVFMKLLCIELTLDSCTQFTHRVIGDICDKEGLHYEEFAKSLSLSEYSKLKLCLSDLFRTLTREKIEKDKIIEKLKGLNVSAETSQIIATCLWVRRDEIRAQLVRDSCNIAHSNLSDFDWSLKVHACMVDIDNTVIICTLLDGVYACWLMFDLSVSYTVVVSSYHHNCLQLSRLCVYSKYYSCTCTSEYTQRYGLLDHSILKGTLVSPSYCYTI